MIPERPYLILGLSLSAGDDRAGMAHPSSRGRCLSGNKGHHGFGELLLDILRCFFLRGAAYLPDYHCTFCGIIILEPP